MPAVIDDVCRALRACRLRFGDEIELQDGIERLFQAKGFLYEREAQLDGAGRVDFLVFGSGEVQAPSVAIGVEVKIKGSTAEVTRQLHRYASTGKLSGLVLATTLMRHATQLRMPSLGGVEFRSLYLSGSAF